MTNPFMDEVYEAAVEVVGNAIERLREIWNEFVDGFNAVLKVLPDVLSPGLRYAFQKLWSLFTEMLNMVWKVYTERGSASAVRAVASAWNTEVGKKAGDQAALLALGQLPSTGFWSGPAASRYIHVVNGQTKALTEIKTTTNSMQTVLNEIADALKTFWSKLAVGVGGYVVVMAAAAIGTSFGLTTREAILGAIAATAAFIALMNDLVTDFGNTLDSTEKELERLATTDGSFAGGNWPPATADSLSALATAVS
jgi:hypothetical protein